MRVSIEAMSPPASASVGVLMRGALSPGLGMVSADSSMTGSRGTAEVAATRRSSSRAMPSTSYSPETSNGMLAT